MRQTVNATAMPSWLAGLALLLALVTAPALAGGDDPYPEFVALYDVKLNGIKVGYAKFSLRHDGANQYLYESEAGKSGVVSLFGSDTAMESSRWRWVDNGIQVLEYKAQRKGGDDDDNARLVFDWERLRVENRGAGEHWNIVVPDGTLDKMVMQLAMLFDLRDGKRVFEYPVALRGRIKHYRFELAGEDSTELAFGTYRTLRLERRDDDEDRSWVWSAPDLNYFPVRFVKHKGNGLKTEIVLQQLDFKPPLTADN